MGDIEQRGNRLTFAKGGRAGFKHGSTGVATLRGRRIKRL